MAACEIHVTHLPKALTLESHHVIPQAWQHFWRPSLGDGDLRVLKVPALWDPRTVELCPTGHRNVHEWIVTLMRGVGGLPLYAPRGARKERELAQIGLDRFRSAGGNLELLVAARLWGNA